ncbi:MAG: site-specific integrase, partial [Acidobacteriota bacterium]
GVIYKRKKHWHMDVMVGGVRYREALHTSDRREAAALEKKRIGEIQAGKAASPTGREFGRKPFGAAADQFLEDRKPHVAERTTQFERERLKPLRGFFGDKPLLRIKAEDIGAYQKARLEKAIAGRTINMEVSVLRRMLKRAKVWAPLAEDVRMFPEHGEAIARVLTAEEKRLLFQTAGSKPEWLVAHCAAVLAVSTTCRGVELRNLRWQNVDLFERVIAIRRSKGRTAGQRAIPLNSDAVAALARLRERAEAHGATAPEHFVFPTCEHERIDPTRPQKTWRTAWRALLKEAARRAGREAAKAALEAGLGIGKAKAAWKRAAQSFIGFRFHDLRHQAITELAEAGAPDATLMALAGHLSRRMLEHYSHVRMAAK